MQWHMFIAVLGGIGNAIIYGYKVNLSVALTVMINRTAIMQESIESFHDLSIQSNLTGNEICDSTLSDESGAPSSDTSHTHGPLLWTPTEYNLAIGSYFYGYIMTQIPGGYIAETGSAKWIFFGAVFMNIIATLLIAPASYVSVYCVVVLRIVQGFGAGATFPAITVIISRWTPPAKRSLTSAIIFGGTSLGTVISLVTAGQIATALSWEWIFYIHGLLPLVWCAAWIHFVSDTPEEHRYISDDERQLIARSLASVQKTKRQRAVPWQRMWRSVPFWCILVCHPLNNWGWYMLLVELPIFMSTGLGFDISKNSLLSAIPYLLNWLFSIGYSWLLDLMKKKGWISPTNGLKMSMLLSSIIPAACLVAVSLSGCNRSLVVTFMIIGLTFYGAMFSGIVSNHVCLASNFSGIMMGITNTVGTVSGIVVPAFIGYVTSTPGLDAWHLTFYVTASLLLFEAFVYTLFASGVEQEWNKLQDCPRVVNLTADQREEAEAEEMTKMKNVQ